MPAETTSTTGEANEQLTGDAELDSAIEGALEEPDIGEAPSKKGGERAKTDEDDDESAPEPDDDDDTGPPREDPDWWSLDDSDVIDAIQVMRRNQWDLDEIKLIGSKEKLLAKAEKLAKVQADVARKLRGQGDSKTDTETENGTAPPAQADTAVDISAYVRPLAEHLGLEDDGTKVLTKAMQEIHQTQRAADRAADAALTGNLMAHLENIALRLARQELVGEIPQLASDDVFKDALEEALELGRLGKHKDKVGVDRTISLLRDGIRLRRPNLPSPTQQNRKQRASDKRSRSSVNPPKGRAPAPPLNEIDRGVRMLKEMDEGVDEHEILSRWGR